MECKTQALVMEWEKEHKTKITQNNVQFFLKSKRKNKKE
jgi:hypothetical protein